MPEEICNNLHYLNIDILIFLIFLIVISLIIYILLVATVSTSRSSRFRKQYLDYDNDEYEVKVLKVKHELSKKGM